MRYTPGKLKEETVPQPETTRTVAKIASVFIRVFMGLGSGGRGQ
jgi:hypothetical protein